MSCVLEKTQNGVEVTVGADMTQESLCDITKDTCDVCSDLYITMYVEDFIELYASR